MNTSILIAGEHFPIINGLRALTMNVLGGEVDIDTASNYPSVLKQLKDKKFDLLICDVFMEGTESLTLLEKALSLHPDIKILVVSLNPSSIFAPRFLEAGASGYISTTDTEDEFKKAIWQTHLGKKYIPKSIDYDPNTDRQHKGIENPFHRLSKQEFSVLLILLEGKGIKEVGNILDLKISTASTYRMRIFNKLKVNNLMELSHLARLFKINANNIHISN